MHHQHVKDAKVLIRPARGRALSCPESIRLPDYDLPLEPESKFIQVRRITRERVQDNPITFHCCPPEGNLANLLTLIFATFAILLAALAVLGHRAAPGGNVFALLVLILLALVGGVLVRLFNLLIFKCCNIDLRFPALLGMLVVGILLENVPYNMLETGQTECLHYNSTKIEEEIQYQLKRSIAIDQDEDGNVIQGKDTANLIKCELRYIGLDLDPKISTMLRTICLTVILLMAGLEIDPVALWNLRGMVLRATFIPCFVECIVIAIMSNLVLGFPWTVGFMLGFVVAAVSPAVIIPCLVSLSSRGYGVEKGIPTLVIAASSVDDVVAISGFGIFLGLTFFKDASIVQLLMHGPLEVLLGVSFGTLWGLMAQWIPNKQHRNVTFFRWVILFSGGLSALFGAHWLKYDGAGVLATIIMAFVAGMQWRKEGWGDHNPVTKVFTKIWIVLETLLFGLIGTEIQINKIDPESLGWGILVLVTALIFRMVGTVFAVSCGNLNVKEKIFLAFACLPKATDQAALGPIFLERAKHAEMTEMYHMGEQILTLAVLSIVITAPLGAVTIMGLGPKLLEKQADEGDDDVNEDDQENTNAPEQSSFTDNGAVNYIDED